MEAQVNGRKHREAQGSTGTVLLLPLYALTGCLPLYQAFSVCLLYFSSVSRNLRQSSSSWKISCLLAPRSIMCYVPLLLFSRALRGIGITLVIRPLQPCELEKGMVNSFFLYLVLMQKRQFSLPFLVLENRIRNFKV